MRLDQNKVTSIRGCWIVAVIFSILLLPAAVYSNEKTVTAASKYQVVAGSDDKAYLVDTSTGMVWILTFRTLPTGREPVAIPFKFIRISPKNQGDFLIENIPGQVMSVEEKLQH